MTNEEDLGLPKMDLAKMGGNWHNEKGKPFLTHP